VKTELPVIVVSGLPRSGTSMVMRMLQAGGLEVVTDHVRKPDEHNPVGYFEDNRIKSLGENNAWLTEASGRAVKVVSMLLYHLPPTCRYQIVFVRRRMEEILLSQRKMLQQLNRDQGGVDDATMATKLDAHLRKIEGWIPRQPNMSCMYVTYDEVVLDPRGHAERLANFLGGNLDVDAMARSVDASLYRSRPVSS